MLLSTTLEVQSSCNPLLVMFSRNSREGISQIIQASFCSSTMPRSWSTPIVAHQRLWLLFLCTPGSQSMLLPSCPQHHLYSVHGSRPCSSDCPRMANYSCSHSQLTSFLKSNSIYQVPLLWISYKMNYYNMYSILSEIPLSLKLVRVTYICKWTSCISANSQSSISFIEWSIPKLISPLYCWLTDV